MHELYFNPLSVPDEYQLPYWSTVGSNPTIEQMSACVNDAKIRPHIKQEWVDFKVQKFINYNNLKI